MLVIEDDDIDAEVLLRIVDRLPDRDWRVVRARTLSVALSILEIESPDVALVDLNLADAWHSDTVQALVEAAPGCPIIVQTGLDDPSVPSEMLRLGAQDFLQKGTITVDSLGRSIRHAIARHQTLDALRRTWSRLAVANEELDGFAHIVAHDLRAPARTAKMLSTRLVQELPEESSDLAYELGNRLEAALGHMDDMIISMLDYAGLRRELPRASEVSVLGVVNKSLELSEADVIEIDAVVDVQIDEDLDVYADFQLLQRVVSNIISNSIKYRSPHRPTHISISAERKGSFVELRLVDNGIGIPESETERVFGVLERLAHRDVEGLGFGLAICRRIVDGFRGKIWIDTDRQSVGCTFVVRLPCPPKDFADDIIIHLD